VALGGGFDTEKLHVAPEQLVLSVGGWVVVVVDGGGAVVDVVELVGPGIVLAVVVVLAIVPEGPVVAISERPLVNSWVAPLRRALRPPMTATTKTPSSRAYSRAVAARSPRARVARLTARVRCRLRT
jgi:hypothetical protein